MTVLSMYLGRAASSHTRDAAWLSSLFEGIFIIKKIVGSVRMALSYNFQMLDLFNSEAPLALYSGPFFTYLF